MSKDTLAQPPMYDLFDRVPSGLFRLLLLLALFGLGDPGSVQAQQYDPTPQTVQFISSNPQLYVGRKVKLPKYVTVTRILGRDRESGTTRYLVKDKRGAVIPVFTTASPPDVNAKYYIKGQVEENRAGGGASRVVVNELERSQPTNWLLYSIVALGVVVVGLGGYVFIQRGSEGGEARTDEDDFDRRPSGGPSKGSGPQPEGPTGPPGGTEPSSPGSEEESTTETETVKFSTRPQETVKMLGRLEVLSGHDEPEIPLMAPVSGQGPTGAGLRYSIGRAPASADNKFTHIQLKPRTVSREQAELSHVNNSFRLTNLVSEQKNPTLVNGTALDMGDQVSLSDGDTITMGEVKLRLHEGV